MKFGFPWSVKGTVIPQQAAQAGLMGQPHARAHGAAADDVGNAGGTAAECAIAALDRALAEIATRQRTLNGEPAPVAPPPMPLSAPPLRDAVPTQDISGLEQQLRKITDQIETLRKPGVEEAINALRGELGDIGRALDEAMPKPAIDAIEKQIAGLSQRIAEGRQAGVDAGALAGIERGLTEVRDALRGLTPAEHLIGFNHAVAGLAEKIDLIVAEKDPATLRQLEDAIATLRGMASNVASNETVGRLTAVVQCLADQVEQIGSGPAGDVLNGLENRIDALSRALAERAQAGDTVPPRLEALVLSLSDKFERISSGPAGDVLNGLENRIDALSRALAERAQAGETVPPRLEALVHSLSDKVERIGSGPAGDVLNGLENRIDALSRALAERAQAGDTVPPGLEALVHSLSDKIDQIQQSHGDNVAVSHLEDRIVSLMERLDASDSRFGHLEAIERGLADLLVHIEEMRADKQDTRTGDSPVVEALKYDMARTEDALKHDMARTQDTLEAVHDTLGLMVDRLALIEEDIRSERRAAPPAAPANPAAESEPLELTQPFGRQASIPAQAPTTSMPAHAPSAPMLVAKPQPQPPPAPALPRLPSASQLPINPDLPPDQPLEPGSRPPQLSAHPAARIAASEAALGGARPAQPAAAGQANFIAAARRAAKAALQEHEVNAPRAVEPAYPEPRGHLSSLRDKMMKRVKSLLVAASIVAVVIGSAQISGNMFRGTGGMTKTAKHLNAKPAKAPTVPKLTAAPLAPAASNPLMAPAPIALPLHTGAAAQRMPDLLKPPALYSGGDITGSIPDAARSRHPAPLPAAAPVDGAERLPSAIGSPDLRKAALAGDAGAAYEVAVRFAAGRGVPANPRKAAHWYKRAAAKGLAVAQFRYASVLEKGLGVKKDLAQARRLYHAAAGQGNAKAMHNLAVLYAEGIDGKPDYATAVAWFRKAAQHGVVDSQYNLGVLYARGIGIDKNFGKSYKWFALAAAHGDKDAAKKRDNVAGRLNPKELAAARRAVESFTIVPQPEIATAAPAPPGGWEKASAAPAKP